MRQSKQEQKRQVESEEIINQFNKKYPVGSTVKHRKTTSSEFEDRIVRSSAFLSGSYDPVVFFHGISGYYIISNEFIKDL